MSDSPIKPADVSFRSEKNGLVADVKNGEAFVDQQVQAAAEKKKTEKVWDAAKAPFRKFARDVQLMAEEQDQKIIRVNFLGSAEAIIEVELSSTRKALPESAMVLASKADLGAFVAEEKEVVLRGELAEWALNGLGDRTGVDPRFTLKTQRVLIPTFEDFARQERHLKTNRLDAIAQLEELGFRASAVEAKIKSGG